MNRYSIPGESAGRAAEERRIDEIAKSFIITTTQSVIGRGIAAYLGVVSETVVLGQGMKNAWSLEFADAAGKVSNSFEQKVVEAKSELFRRMSHSLYHAGGDAIVGLSIDVEMSNTNAIIVTGTGTMVKLS